MKYIAALMVVAMATIASGGSVQMMELTPALSSGPDCEVSLWCKDYATAARCGKVTYCREWIWEDTMGAEPAITCDGCKTTVEKVLEYNVTIIDDVCDLCKVPILDKKCDEFLENVIAKVTPLKVCTFVHICPQSEPLEAETVNSNISCVFCKEAAKWLLENLEDIKPILEAFCKKTPVPDECEVLVDFLFEELKDLNASFICKGLHLCTNVSRQLLGGDLCTRGPSYWCASHSNALACRAVDYCNKKYWF